MCIRDRAEVGLTVEEAFPVLAGSRLAQRLVAVMERGVPICLLYTSDAADDLLCVDLGGRRIIKKKINTLDQLDSYS